MKKWICLWLALMLCLLAGCGGTEPTEPPTEAPTEAPTQAPTQAPGLSLADTAWEVEGVIYLFYADGTLTAQAGGDKVSGSYTWDGQNGVAVLQDSDAALLCMGENLYMEGEDGNAYRLTYLGTLAEFEASAPALPSPEDPLDCEVRIPDSDPAIYIPYPETMQVVKESSQLIQLDAVNGAAEMENNILVNLVSIGTGFDHYFTSGPSRAEEGLSYMLDLWSEGAYGDNIISRMETQLEDCGYYYAFRQYVWFSGEVFVESADTPVMGLLEMRYYGPTGYVLVFVTAADQGRFENYVEIATNIFDAVDYGGDWSTAPAAYDEGRGDYFPEEDDGRGDYIPDEEGRGDVIP